MISILISSYNRLQLLRRALWSIAKNAPSEPYEVILCDEESTEDIHSLLKEFSFPWKLIKVKTKDIEEKLNCKKFYNNPSVTNNIAFEHSNGDKIFLMGNEIIVWDDTFNKLLKDIESEDYLIFSETYNVPNQILSILDKYGSNITKNIVNYCKQWPLHNHSYRSDVTNYLSLCSRNLWKQLDGYCEKYYLGIACEDSDFVRRARAFGVKTKLSNCISLHQNHSGKTIYQESTTIDNDVWDKGLKINRHVYNNWDGSYKNPQNWKSGQYKVEVITNE